MRVSLVQSAAIAAGLLTGFFGPFAIDSGLPGIAPAQAKEYYTKKRVNGKWIAGRFAKRDAVKRKVAARTAPARAVPARTGQAANRMPANPILAKAVAEPTPAVAPLPPSATPPVRVGASASSPPAPAAAALAEDGRMRQLQEALQARTQTLVVTSLAPTPPAAPTPSLQEALQARSRNILVTSLVDPTPAAVDLSGPSETASLGPVRAIAPRTELRSVTFDFSSGLKTTVFGDGAVVAEPFDVRAMRDLGSRREAAVN